MAREAGKGSSRRRSDIPDEVISDNWQNIFGKKTEATQTDSQRGDFGGIIHTVEEVFDPHQTINS